MFEKINPKNLLVWTEEGKLYFSYALEEKELIKAAGRISLGKTADLPTKYKWNIKGNDLVLELESGKGSIHIETIVKSYEEMVS